MSTLRTDPRQWLIYQEENVKAGMEAIEVMALTITGTLLARGEEVEMRAIGNIMMRWADARQRTLSDEEASDLERTAVSHITDILDWMGGQGDEPNDALSELHAVAFAFDSQLQGAGIDGEGWYRVLARGEHGR